MTFQIKASTTDDRVRAIHKESWKGTTYAEVPVAADLTDEQITRLGLNLLQEKGFVNDVNQFLHHSRIEVIRTHLVGTHDM